MCPGGKTELPDKLCLYVDCFGFTSQTPVYNTFTLLRLLE